MQAGGTCLESTCNSVSRVTGGRNRPFPDQRQAGDHGSVSSAQLNHRRSEAGRKMTTLHLTTSST